MSAATVLSTAAHASRTLTVDLDRGRVRVEISSDQEVAVYHEVTWSHDPMAYGTWDGRSLDLDESRGLSADDLEQIEWALAKASEPATARVATLTDAEIAADWHARLEAVS